MKPPTSEPENVYKFSLLASRDFLLEKKSSKGGKDKLLKANQRLSKSLNLDQEYFLQCIPLVLFPVQVPVYLVSYNISIVNYKPLGRAQSGKQFIIHCSNRSTRAKSVIKSQ